MRDAQPTHTLAGEALRRARVHAHLSQRDLAERAGVAHSTVARIESGARQPSVPTWAKLLRAIGADLTVTERKPTTAHRRNAANRVAKWSPPVEVPGDLSELKGPITGRIRLPASVYSSGAGSQRVFDLDDEQQRIRIYQIVLANGTADDIRRYLNVNELLRLWPKLWLPPHVQNAWADKIPFPSGGQR